MIGNFGRSGKSVVVTLVVTSLPTLAPRLGLNFLQLGIAEVGEPSPDAA